MTIWRDGKQAKCPTCKVRWVWKGKPLVKDATCPDCGRKLMRTSYKLQWPTKNLWSSKMSVEE